jgi:hypothetical protein
MSLNPLKHSQFSRKWANCQLLAADGQMLQPPPERKEASMELAKIVDRRE